MRCFLTWSKPFAAGCGGSATIMIFRTSPVIVSMAKPFLLTGTFREKGPGRTVFAHHEIVEKALLDELRLHYLHAHQIATRAERDAVKAAGVSWWAYQSFMKKHEKQLQEVTLVRSPDIGPYTLPRRKGFWAVGAAGTQREMK
jgi:hypothetical protein